VKRIRRSPQRVSQYSGELELVLGGSWPPWITTCGRRSNERMQALKGQAQPPHASGLLPPEGHTTRKIGKSSGRGSADFHPHIRLIPAPAATAARKRGRRRHDRRYRRSRCPANRHDTTATQPGCYHKGQYACPVQVCAKTHEGSRSSIEISQSALERRPDVIVHIMTGPTSSWHFYGRAASNKGDNPFGA